MPLDLYLAFLLATTVLILIPGPNVTLLVATSLAHGPRRALITLAGTSSAIALQLVVVALGMTSLILALAGWFEWLRWAGVAYLVWLGIAQWRAPPEDLTRTAPEPKSHRAILVRAFLVSLVNPKTLLFYGAFFPQFLNPTADIATQVALLSATFLALAVLLDSGWALLVRWYKPLVMAALPLLWAALALVLLQRRRRRDARRAR